MPSRLWKTFALGCVSSVGSGGPVQKVRFGVPLEKAFRDGVIPSLLLDLLVYISREGVTVRDIFRRSGNNSDVKRLVKRLSEGKATDFAEYSFYTLASVVKKFLLGIPGGIFGIEAEDKLLMILQFHDQLEMFDYVNKIILSLPKSVQQFSALLFGIWFRIVNHSEFHGMSPEAMAKSVTGCIFRNAAESPATVKNAAKVMEILIDEFAMPSLFGSENLQYFADTTCSGILVQEQFTVEYSHPSSNSVPTVGTNGDGQTRGLSRLALDGGDCSTGIILSGAVVQRLPVCGAVIPSRVVERAHLPALCSSAPDVNSQAAQGLTGEDPNCSRSSQGPSHHPLPLLSTPPLCHSSSNNLSKSLTRFDTVKSRQMARLQKRSHWFLTSGAAAATSKYPSANESVASRDAQSLTHWPAADGGTKRDLLAAGCSGDCGTVVSSDDALSVFTDLDEGNDCSGSRCMSNMSVESVTAVDGSCGPSIPSLFETTTRRYVRETFYGPKALAKAS